MIQAAFKAEFFKGAKCCSLAPGQVGSETEPFDPPASEECTPEACAIEYSRILGNAKAKEEGEAPRNGNLHKAFDKFDKWEIKINKEPNGEEHKMAVAVDSLGTVTSEDDESDPSDGSIDDELDFNA